MEANSFNMRSMMMQSSSFNCSADIRGSKKPDKALSCPRCNSMETKFCYYNNYNVNQPRHFCKGCQRYWTAGGTLRNVAIGAGRRKRKHCSLDSESISEVSSVECHHAQEFSAARRVSSSCGSAGGSSRSKAPSDDVSDLADRKPRLLSFDANCFPLVGNLSSPKVQGHVSNELMCAKQSLISQHSSGQLSSSHDNRNHKSIFHEFLHPKHDAALSDRYTASCHLSIRAPDAVDHLKLETPSTHVDMQKNDHVDIGSKLALATPSDESGCASSLTTQALSVDICANDGKSDAMDSEVTKEAEICDQVGSLVTESLQSGFNVSCKTVGGAAASGFSHCNVKGMATLAPTYPLPWKRQSENPAVGTAWGMLPMPLSLGPAGDKALYWGFPWGPTVSAVNAARAALIQNAREFEKSHLAPIVPLPQRTQPVPDAHVSQKSGVEPDAPSEMRVWVPKTLRIKDVDEAARSSIWSTLGIREKGSIMSDRTQGTFQCNAKEVGVAAVQSQYANPAALSHSMAFQESG